MVVDVNVTFILGEVSLSVGLIKHAPLLGLDIQSVLGTLKNEITVFGPIPDRSETANDKACAAL